MTKAELYRVVKYLRPDFVNGDAVFNRIIHQIMKSLDKQPKLCFFDVELHYLDCFSSRQAPITS